MARVRAVPPASVAGIDVVETIDLAEGNDLPPTDGVVWHLADGSRVVVRPSGTEPKLKAYLEVVEPVVGERRAAVDAATATAEQRLTALTDAVRTILDPA